MQLAIALSASLRPDAGQKPGKKKRMTKAEKQALKPDPLLLITTDQEREDHVSRKLAEMLSSASELNADESPSASAKMPLRPSTLSAQKQEDGRSAWSMMAGREQADSGAYTIPGVQLMATPERIAPAPATAAMVTAAATTSCAASAAVILGAACSSSLAGASAKLASPAIPFSPSPVVPASQQSPVRVLQSLWGGDSASSTGGGMVTVTMGDLGDLQQQLAALVDSSAGSDVRLVGTDGVVHAHSVLLRSRCLADGDGTKWGFLDVDSGDHTGAWVSNPTNPRDVVFAAPRGALLAVLRFVYSGATEFPRGVAEHVATIAPAFGQHELQRAAADACASSTSPDHATQGSQPSPTGQTAWDVVAAAEFEEPGFPQASRPRSCSPMAVEPSPEVHAVSSDSDESSDETRATASPVSTNQPPSETMGGHRTKHGNGHPQQAGAASSHGIASSAAADTSSPLRPRANATSAAVAATSAAVAADAPRLSQQSPQTLHQQVVQAIKHDETIYMRVLQYVPLDVNKLSDSLATAGIQTKLPQLIEVLNAESITYCDPTGQKSRTKKRTRRPKNK